MTDPGEKLTFEQKQALWNQPCPGGFEHEASMGFENSAGHTQECDHCPAVRFQPSNWTRERRPWDPARHGEPPDYDGLYLGDLVQCRRCGAVVVDQELHTGWHRAH